MAQREHLARIFKDPTLIAVEIAWRWLFAASSLSLLMFAMVRLQRAVVILPEEQAMLASRAPLQVAEAILEIWHRVQPLAVRLGATVIPAVVILWLIASTVGRGFVIGRMHKPTVVAPRWGALFTLHLLRVISVFALLFAYIGCSRATLLVSSPDAPNYLAAFLVFLILFSVSVLLWSLIHWVISLACIFAVRDGAATLKALRKTSVLLKVRGRILAGIAAQNGTIRTVVAIVITFVALLPLAFYSMPALLWTLEIVIFLFYCAVSDILLLARLAAYVEAAEPTALPEIATEN